jgi:hypothetical protein
MYVEACRSFDRTDGPESMHVAGYELREFMNVLNEVLDLPTVDHQQLRGRTQDFVRRWESRRGSTRCHKDGEWTGTIDRELVLLLKDADEFVIWVRTQVSSRKVESEWVIRKLLPTDDPMPQALLDKSTESWTEMLKYFNALAHHDIEPDRDTVTRQIEALEVFLLDHLEPQTFSDQDDIDELITEVESHDDTQGQGR